MQAAQSHILSRPLTEQDREALRYKYDAVLQLLHLAYGQAFVDMLWTQVNEFGGKPSMVNHLGDEDVPDGFDIYDRSTWPQIQCTLRSRLCASHPHPRV